MKRLFLAALVLGLSGAAIAHAQSAPDQSATLASVRAKLVEAIAVIDAASTTEVPTSTSSTSSSTTTTLAPTTTTSPSSTTTSTTVAPTTTTVAATTTTTTPSSSFPDGTNTGVPAGTALTPYTGPCTISTAGTVVDAKTIACQTMTISAANVTIKRSVINGNSFGVIRPTSSGFVMTDVDLTCSNSAGSYGILYGSGTYTRLNIHNCENAIEPGSNVVFRDSWIHGLAADGAPHYDGVSIDGAVTNVQVLRNTVAIAIGGGNVSAVMIDNYGGGTISGVTVDGNKVAGGQFALYADTQFTSGTIQATVTNNRFGRSNYGYANISQSKTNISQSGNRDDATNALISL